jgi:hypothetical protein
MLNPNPEKSSSRFPDAASGTGLYEEIDGMGIALEMNAESNYRRYLKKNLE